MPIRCLPAGAFVLALLLLLVPTHPASGQAATWQSFCSSLSGDTGYFSSAFDTGLNGKAGVNLAPIGRDFSSISRAGSATAPTRPMR